MFRSFIETHSQYSPNSRLSAFALLTALATLGLLALGGLVTSHGAGMAVPDWPNTYGYNMFFFPVSQWVGGIYYEHTHRLLASMVGLLTSILALWLYGRKARPLMRWLGAVLVAGALVMVIGWPRRWSDGLVLGISGAALLGSSLAWPRCEPARDGCGGWAWPRSWASCCKAFWAGCESCSSRTSSAFFTRRWARSFSC